MRQFVRLAILQPKSEGALPKAEYRLLGFGGKGRRKIAGAQWPMHDAPASPRRDYALEARKPINFNQTYSRSTISPRKNSSILSRGDGHNHGRLKVILRWQPCRLNRRLL